MKYITCLIVIIIIFQQRGKEVIASRPSVIALVSVSREVLINAREETAWRK